MIHTFKKENEIKRYEVQDGKVLCTIEIGGRWVSNPTLEVFLEQGWEEYTPPTPPAPQPYMPTYEELVVMKIHERYSIDDELALLRQRDTKADEFAEYNDFCEQCKAEARSEIDSIVENLTE
jgi:hypothetical protein